MEERIFQELQAIKAYSILAAKNVLDLDDVSALTGLSKSYLYKLTCSHDIPHFKPRCKQLYFDRKEIEDWMKQNRVATNAELENQAITYLTTGRK